jgi:hypothetical protein
MLDPAALVDDHVADGTVARLGSGQAGEDGEKKSEEHRRRRWREESQAKTTVRV